MHSSRAMYRTECQACLGHFGVHVSFTENVHNTNRMVKEDTPPAISALGVTQCGLEGHRAIPYVKGDRHLRGARLIGYVFCPRTVVFG